MRRAPSRRSWSRRRRLTTWIAILALAAAAVILSWFFMIRMPGTSHAGPLPPATAEEKALAAALEADVRMLAQTIGKRNVWAAAGYSRRGRPHRGGSPGRRVRRRAHEFTAADHRCENLEATLVGTSAPSDEIVVVGAHYDSVRDTVGANDNASGVAALLALARALHRPPRGAHAPVRRIRERGAALVPDDEHGQPRLRARHAANGTSRSARC